jgi:hypothetical protein
MTGRQTEFAMSIAVCAWCKPDEHGGNVGSLSHGICPRHLKKIKLRLHSSAKKRRRSATQKDLKMDALLPF